MVIIMQQAIILILPLMTAITNSIPAGKRTKPTLEFVRKSYETRFYDLVAFDVKLFYSCFRIITMYFLYPIAKLHMVADQYRLIVVMLNGQGNSL